MSIKQKILVNSFVLILVAVYLIAFEMYEFHPDAFSIFDLKM